MPTTVTYPSPEFPAAPAVSLPCPDGWQTLTVAEALVAIGKTLDTPQFQPNVVITSRRTLDATLEQVADATAEALQGSPDWAETGREYRDGAFGGHHRAFRIEGAFTHPQAGSVYQAALLTVVQQGPFFDVVQAVASCAASQVMERLPEMRTCLQEAAILS